MKKKIGFKIFHWLIGAIPKAIVIFALGAGAFYVYAQSVTFPGVAPYTVTGVVGQFVGVTEEVYDGGVQGYANVNQLCNRGAGDLAGSHICTSMELINSYNMGSDVIVAQTGDAWFNNGPPAHSDTLSNDCQGWTSTSASHFGSLWKFAAPRRGLIMFCNQVPTDFDGYPFACCR